MVLLPAKKSSDMLGILAPKSWSRPNPNSYRPSGVVTSSEEPVTVEDTTEMSVPPITNCWLSAEAAGAMAQSNNTKTAARIYLAEIFIITPGEFPESRGLNAKKLYAARIADDRRFRVLRGSISP